MPPPNCQRYGARLLGRLRRGRRKFNDASRFVVDDHRQIEIADGRNRAGAGLDVREPFGVVAALRCFPRRPNIKRAAGAIVANDIVLANELLVGSPSRHGRARVFENLHSRVRPGGYVNCTNSTIIDQSFPVFFSHSQHRREKALTHRPNRIVAPRQIVLPGYSSRTAARTHRVAEPMPPLIGALVVRTFPQGPSRTSLIRAKLTLIRCILRPYEPAETVERFECAAGNLPSLATSISAEQRAGTLLSVEVVGLDRRRRSPE